MNLLGFLNILGLNLTLITSSESIHFKKNSEEIKKKIW